MCTEQNNTISLEGYTGEIIGSRWPIESVRNLSVRVICVFVVWDFAWSLAGLAESTSQQCGKQHVGAANWFAFGAGGFGCGVGRMQQGGFQLVEH